MMAGVSHLTRAGLVLRLMKENRNSGPLECGGSSWGTQGRGGLHGEFNFSNSGGKTGPPARLVYYTWVEVQDLVEFEFRDVPLP